MSPSVCVPWVSAPATSLGSCWVWASPVAMASLPQTLDICEDRFDVCRGHRVETSPG